MPYTVKLMKKRQAGNYFLFFQIYSDNCPKSREFIFTTTPWSTAAHIGTRRVSLLPSARGQMP